MSKYDVGVWETDCALYMIGNTATDRKGSSILECYKAVVVICESVVMRICLCRGAAVVGC
jgi:hypothetical protein